MKFSFDPFGFPKRHAFTSVRNVPNTWALRKKLRRGLSVRIIVGRSTPITERTMFVEFSQFFCVVSVTSAFAVHEFSLRITMPEFGSNQSNEIPSVFCLRYRAVSSPVREHMSMYRACLIEPGSLATMGAAFMLI